MKQFLSGLGIGLFFCFVVWSSMIDRVHREVREVEGEYEEKYSSLGSETYDLEQELSTAKSCIESLKYDNSRMSSSLDSINDALHPFQYGEPTFDEAYDILREVDYYTDTTGGTSFLVCN